MLPPSVLNTLEGVAVREPRTGDIATLIMADDKSIKQVQGIAYLWFEFNETRRRHAFVVADSMGTRIVLGLDLIRPNQADKSEGAGWIQG